MSDTMQAKMVSDALLMVVWWRGKPSALVHHLDHGITCSLSRRGECWDIAAMERFFSSLKTERTSRKVYRAREEARSDVFDHIERFYNPVRRHSKPPFISPVQFEEGSKG